WTMMVRQPEFVTIEVFNWAKEELHKKKPDLDLSKVRLETYEEGKCAQIMHIGSYDDEYISKEKLESLIFETGYEYDINEKRKHHEIYISDPRKVAAEKLKTVIRYPIKKQT
ncbi:MAG: GyrI-like domain-containing protein, partial [Bacilli bacterium]|nr:GyrI-like domain-containing protein [Bacilli bacterium]